MKRNDVLTVILAMLLSCIASTASSGNVWSGSFYPESWNKELYVWLSGLSNGDKVVFHGDAFNDAQLQINSKDWTENFTGNYTAFNGKYTIKVTNANAEKLNQGVIVKGQNFKLTSVEVIKKSDGGTSKFANLPWYGSFDPNSWNSSLALKAGSLSAGDKIRFHGECYSEAQIQIANNNFTSYVKFDGNDFTSFYDGLEIWVTNENINTFKNGFYAKGQKFKLTSVEVIKKSDGGTSKFANLPWYGSFDPNSWNSSLALKAGSLSAGDKIRFHGESYSGAQIQIANNNFTSYVKFEGNDFTPFYDGLEIWVTNENLDIFKNGFNVKGQNFKLNSVEVIKNSGTGGTSTCNGGFYTKGTKLYDSNGNEFIMRGVNYSWCWQYGSGDGNTADDVIPAAKRQGANCIRIQLSDGANSSWKKPTASELKELIRLCEENKLIVILNTHDETGSNNVEDLKRAANFWISVKDILNAHKTTVLVNVSNEWYGSWNADPWARGYEEVIPMLRNAGIENTLVIDCAGYGQYPASIAMSGARVLAADSKKNLIFSEHLYDCFPTEYDVTTAIDNALNVGAPVIVGEFAYRHKGKDVAWQAIMDHCKERGVGYLGWSWTGNGGGTGECDMFGGYDDSNIKQNGIDIIYGSNGIKQTSVECSVYNRTYSKYDSLTESGNGQATGIGTVTTINHPNIDYSRPYEIYTLSGKKISSYYSDGKPHFYIIRQNGNSVKVIR